MRSALLFATALAAVACTGDAVHLEHHSTLQNATRGIALLGGGQGHGAMLDTTCAFDGMDGFVWADVNLPTPTERITGQLGGELVVGVSDEGIHPMIWGERRPELEIPLAGVLDAKPTEAGIFWLRADADGCFVGQENAAAEVAIGACTDRARLVVSTDGGLRYVHDAGVLRNVATGAETSADHAAYDRANGGLLVATGSAVTRLTVDGVLDWSVDVGDGVASLSDLGLRGGAVVVTRRGDLTIHDGGGDRIANVRLPGGADAVVSDDGRDLSLVTPNETHNYTVEDGPPSRGVDVEGPALFED